MVVRKSVASFPWPNRALCAATYMATEMNRSSSLSRWDLSNALSCSPLATASLRLRWWRHGPGCQSNGRRGPYNICKDRPPTLLAQ